MSDPAGTRAEPVRIDVPLGARTYPVMIGSGLLARPGLFADALAARTAVVVTNDRVAPLYLERILAALPGRTVGHVIVPDGEAHKTLATVASLIDAFVAQRLNRDGAIIALGGGVVGDIAGFAAACYQRGIDYIQVPTTLLAQVDSSVGGKTGVNHPGGKNLIGAFHQPLAVFADIDTLGTLPSREFAAGLAEVVKYGLIRDAEFFAWLEAHADALVAREPDALVTAIRRSCEIKAEIVGRDERESAERAVLNFGHTFGHAVEAGVGYGEWLHGEAVAVGMVLATELSRRIGWLGEDTPQRLRQLLERLSLPVAAPRIGAARARALMSMDKKIAAGRLRLVLLREPGAAIVTADFPADELDAILVEGFG
jgi:3-dehydroquinate synthase